MSREAFVESVERVTVDDAPLVMLKVDAGDGNPSTVEFWQPPGEDSPPLPGDRVQLVETSGEGGEAAVGASDMLNVGLAAPGEKRLCGRSSAGEIKVSLWLKADGTLVIENDAGTFQMAPDGKVTINGLTIDAQGNLETAGEVTAAKLLPGTGVSLSTHVHTSAAPSSPTSTPTPGT